MAIELKKLNRKVILKRGLDLVLIGAMIYAALMAFGVVRRGGRFEEGRVAPDFTVHSLSDGKEVKLSDYKGKPVLLNFFSTDCPSCRRELPHVADIQEEAGDKLQVLVISTDAPTKLKSYLKNEDIELSAAYDRGVAHQAYGVDTIPYLVVIDSEGKIRGDYVGMVKYSDVEPYL
jgi:cytochrome c biogenesis protein CcmG, thiol:disulfide interchange protein DsbE